VKPGLRLGLVRVIKNRADVQPSPYMATISSDPAGEPPCASTGELTAVEGIDTARSRRLIGVGVPSCDCAPGSESGVPNAGMARSGVSGVSEGVAGCDAAAGGRGDSSSGNTNSSRIASESSGSGCAPCTSRRSFERVREGVAAQALLLASTMARVA
jgi:hypothetical protein